MFVCSYLLFNIHQNTVTVLKNYVFHVSQDLLQIRSYVYAEEPNIDIHNFIGTFTRVSVTVMCTWPRACPTKPWKAHSPYSTKACVFNTPSYSVENSNYLLARTESSGCAALLQGHFCSCPSTPLLFPRYLSFSPHPHLRHDEAGASFG